MSISWFLDSDIPRFLALAEREGWICEPEEFTFLLRTFPEGCFVDRQRGESVAFITAIKYDNSAWIGNLIVDEKLRGQGIGSRLMRTALSALHNAGAKTIWLTASELGAPIYSGLGFTVMDTIQRWRGYGTIRPALATAVSDITFEKLAEIDRRGWGDNRVTLLCEAFQTGTYRMKSNGFIVSHRSPNGIQLGPWGALQPGTAESLFHSVLSVNPEGEGIFLDLPEANHHAAGLLESAGFMVTGTTLLMVHGTTPEYRPEFIYAMASMGSIG